ncbi:MAG: hypothetical protein IPG89_21195 [Bacteroidetes bacterium]|nr:hypothetical protein [Bacteroidota bacterium]
MESKKPFFITLIFSVLLLSILSIVIYNINETKKEREAKIQTLEAYLVNEGNTIVKVSKTRDSLSGQLNYFKKYESLVDATFFRDSTSHSLKYKAGDVVLLKPDSSKAVIKEIIIGGTQFEYYIKYKVILKDRSQLEITPELLY